MPRDLGYAHRLTGPLSLPPATHHEGTMTTKTAARAALLTTSFAALLTAAFATEACAQAVRIDADDIGGVVTSAKGPEAGVWVIAETRDTPTRYTKIVATDDQGRYVLPDLPKGTFDIWVRGYG